MNNNIEALATLVGFGMLFTLFLGNIFMLTVAPALTHHKNAYAFGSQADNHDSAELLLILLIIVVVTGSLHFTQ